MALIKGMLASFSDPLLGAVPTVVTFQYNPTDVTRVFRLSKRGGGVDDGRGSALNAADTSTEEYTLKLELDATDGLERDGVLTAAFGISPRLAAIEMLMQPTGQSVLGGLAGSLLPGGAARVPARKLPLVLFVWGLNRITPVTLRTLTIHETAFDELLNPIHATADLGFTVLRESDIPRSDSLAQAAVSYYKGSREARAVVQLAQIPELA